MTELPNSIKVSSIDKSFTKYKNNLLSSNENSHGSSPKILQKLEITNLKRLGIINRANIFRLAG